MNTNLNLSRGQVIYVNLGKVMGSEQAGTRPCVVISNNKANKFCTAITVAPISSKVRDLPTHVKINLHKPSMVMLEQIRTIDKCRITEITNIVLKGAVMDEINAKIMIALGLHN